jgi:hypothetical protein
MASGPFLCRCRLCFGDISGIGTLSDRLDAQICG